VQKAPKHFILTPKNRGKNCRLGTAFSETLSLMGERTPSYTLRQVPSLHPDSGYTPLPCNWRVVTRDSKAARSALVYCWKRWI